MKCLFRVAIVCFLAIVCTIKAEEVQNVHEEGIETQLAQLKQDYDRLLEEQKQLKMSIDGFASVRTLSNLKVEIDECNERITELKSKVSRKTTSINRLMGSILKLKSKSHMSITQLYLLKLSRTILIDYIYPFLFRFLKYADIILSAIESDLKKFWKYLHTLDWFVRFESQAKQISSLVWAKLMDYWGILCNQVKMVQQRIGPEIPNRIASFFSAAASKLWNAIPPHYQEQLKEIYEAAKIIKNPKVFVSNLQQALQMSFQISMYAELFFYCFILVWISLLVTSVIGYRELCIVCWNILFSSIVHLEERFSFVL
ncbi:uncharacterized protein [Blastocystis hominis]|uniref:Uncharacterized protein n=1 Tax=Blastocystis hominis TaxID=12968 RepID=D8LYD8_BLAHO|nr:uncharacterized protein [Blastocystis hominis]CBK20593.2 unnamed protein product [Blastocystis hominis]|eukprot:XP_012894641.1 uncharacterized protein [Blastocystis hominis]